MPAVLLLIIVGAYFFAKSNEAAASIDELPQIAPIDTPADNAIIGGIVETVKGIIMGSRGERNNNPGNIRISGSNWQGKISGQDSAFETFDSPENGIRALAKLLKNYAGAGYNTIRKIISRYAPSNENNTLAYVNSVSAYMGISADTILDLNNSATLSALVEAIINHENGGVRYTTAQIVDGVSRA